VWAIMVTSCGKLCVSLMAVLYPLPDKPTFETEAECRAYLASAIAPKEVATYQLECRRTDMPYGQ